MLNKVVFNETPNRCRHELRVGFDPKSRVIYKSYVTCVKCNVMLDHDDLIAAINRKIGIK